MPPDPIHNGPNADDLDLVRAALLGERGPDARRIAETGLQWLAMLIRKNHDYGGSTWRTPVLAPGLPIGTAIMVRASDKIERIRGLLAGGTAAVAEESLADTVAALGAYCLLWLARPNNPTPDGRSA